MLEVKGLKRGDYEVKAVGGTPQRFQAMTKDKTYAAAILSPPFRFRRRTPAEGFGCRRRRDRPLSIGCRMGAARMGLGHSDTLVRYIQANIEGIRFALDPANRTVMTGIGRGAAQSCRRTRFARTLQFAFDQKGFRHRREVRHGRFSQRPESCAPTCSAPGAAPRRRRKNISTCLITNVRWPVFSASSI